MSYKHVVGGLFLTSALFMSGCSVNESIANVQDKFADKVASIPVPFEWLKKDPKVVKVIVPEVHGLNLMEEKVDLTRISDFQKNLSEIEQYLTDKKKYKEIVNGNRSIYNLLGSGYMSMDYNDDGDAFTTTIQDMGETENQWIDSLTLKEYGVRVNKKGNTEPYALVNVNAVNDTMDYHIQTLQFSLNQDGRILSSTKVGDPVNKPHTVTPLTTESLLYEDTHKEFQHKLDKVIRSLSNLTVYSQIESREITASDSVIKSIVKEINANPKHTSTIFSLIKDGKGEFKEWGITGYLFDDQDVKGKTYYELTVANDEGYHFYTIQYDRGTKKITDITKGSPFEEESK